MNEFEDVNKFVSLKEGEQESPSPKDWDSHLALVKLRNGARPIAHRRGQSIIQLPDGRVYKT
tara:strand:+ start:41 stop:226 length:186 start_codon:yes stop_codon:yes gene_type:complete